MPRRAILDFQFRTAVDKQWTKIPSFEKATEYSTVQRGTSDGNRIEFLTKRTASRQPRRDDTIVLELGHEHWLLKAEHTYYDRCYIRPPGHAWSSRPRVTLLLRDAAVKTATCRIEALCCRIRRRRQEKRV